MMLYGASEHTNTMIPVTERRASYCRGHTNCIMGHVPTSSIATVPSTANKLQNDIGRYLKWVSTAVDLGCKSATGIL